MNSISVISSVAMAVGLAASLPQILRMLCTRSSGGQSVLGWGMGLITNLSMAYVNLFGFGAKALMASNVLSAALCVAAIGLIVRFARAGEDAFTDDLALTEPIPLRTTTPASPALPAHHGDLVGMPTTEFVALGDAVSAARDCRERRASGHACHEHGLLEHAA